MSRSAGPGSPLTFRCTRCKVGDWRDTGRGTNIQLTGRTKPARRRRYHARGLRSTNTAREYRCRDCGHTGWSTHSNLSRDRLQ